ncbi:PTS system mannose/fructose/N-acetylgalactosamine-transporter subunit IIB [Lacticaseibacillus zhaodongensis]|uniref:PTS system mannose/fructose/N-acetylgalactosamine-transporter subunit IIB n=1 Tax=Lacticaseibacillus zhaodongensis TaxID=2668065 RepID=UPI0012D2FED4|nr:PTS sugar transporter subunit IIB [Lacticaseibacillus zhaodongensis]
MAIEFARIDDRLLHGQVMTGWVTRYSIEQAIIIDDKIAKDEMRQSILKMSAPEGVRVVFFTPDKFVEVFKKAQIKRRTMLLFTGPEAAYICLKGGVKIEYLNVGNMSKTDDNSKITVGVAVTDEDLHYFKQIIDLGIKVEIQGVPAEKKVNMTQFISES